MYIDDAKKYGLAIIKDNPTDDNIKNFIPALLNEKFTLCKYYEDDEDFNPNIVDILLHIDHELDTLCDIQEKQRKNILNKKDPNAGIRLPAEYRYSPKTIKIIEKAIEDLSNIRQTVVEQDFTYYIFNSVPFRDEIKYTCEPISLGSIEGVETSFDRKNLHWTCEPTLIPVLIFGHQVFTGDGKFLTETSLLRDYRYTDRFWALSKESVDLICNQSYFKWNICKNCMNVFLLKESEIEWYKTKNLSVPKTCYKCRREKRKKYE